MAALSPAAQELARRHLPLVTLVARRLARRLRPGTNLDDLISAGYLGLVEAAMAFDPGRSDNFAAFAEFRIRGAMLDDIRSGDSLSRDMRKLSNEMKAAAGAAQARVGRTPEADEIAAELGIAIDQLYARRQKLTGSTVVSVEDAGPDLLERVADARIANPFDEVSRMEIAALIEAAALRLPDRDRAVLLMKYRDDMTLADIGGLMGVTESRICQIHGAAARCLRAQLADVDAGL